MFNFNKFPGCNRLSPLHPPPPPPLKNPGYALVFMDQYNMVGTLVMGGVTLSHLPQESPCYASAVIPLCGILQLLPCVVFCSYYPGRVTRCDSQN